MLFFQLLDYIIADDDCLLFSLSVQFGGFYIPILSKIYTDHFDSSLKITMLLVTIMIRQGEVLPNENDVRHLKHGGK